MPSNLKFSDTSIYDEIYGYIDLTEMELRIIDTPLFQRLNNIKQLGMTYRVFPGAQHTRFSHSLGVMYLIDKMAQNLRLCLEDRKKLRLASLLHDIGHYPLSHTTEVVFTDHNKIEDAKHEKFGAHLINNSSITDILKKNYSEKDILEISSIIQGTSDNPLFNQMMSSELDADRLDYLLRDASHTGVAYGRIDLNRIIHTLDLDTNNYLSIKEEGKHAAEGYIISRYLMWATVYTHRTTSGFDEMIQHIFPRMVEPQYTSFEELKKIDEAQIVEFDDNYIFSKIHENCRSEDDKYLSELCNMFVNRDHLILAADGKLLSEDKEAQENYYHLDAYKSESHIEKLSEICGVDKKWIFHNNSKTQLPTLKPIIEKYIKEEKVEEVEMQKLLRIKQNDGTSFPLIWDKSSIVYALQDLSLDVVRIFTKKGFESRLKDGIEEHWK